MDKRYQVFVSSTYQDLVEERNEVIKALLELDCIPCGMEYFPAASEDQWSYIKSLIDYCDYYVVIIGGRYGSVAPDGISYTQKEYLYALERNIPTIAFIHSNPGKLPADRTEMESDNRRKLGAFVELVQQRLCKTWTSSHELGAVVSRSITQLIKRNPRIGWIRADQAINSDAAQEIVLLSKRIRELEEQISKGTINAPIQDSSSLSQGDDPISIIFNVNLEDTSLKYGNPERQKRDIIAIETTWSELFKYLSPHLHSGIPEGTLKNLFGRFAELRLPDPVRQRSDKYTFSSVRITSESFNVIKVQYTALGMIETYMLETERKSVLAWRLSRRGVDFMYNTIAIRKPDINV